MPIVNLQGSDAMLNELANFESPNNRSTIIDRDATPLQNNYSTNDVSSYYQSNEHSDDSGSHDDDETTAVSTIDDFFLRQTSGRASLISDEISTRSFFSEAERTKDSRSLTSGRVLISDEISTKSFFSEAEKTREYYEDEDKSISSVSWQNNTGIPNIVQRVRSSLAGKSREQLLQQIKEMKVEMRGYRRFKRDYGRMEKQFQHLKCEVGQFRTKETVYMSQIQELTKERDQYKQELEKLEKILEEINPTTPKPNNEKRLNLIRRFFSVQFDNSQDQDINDTSPDSPKDDTDEPTDTPIESSPKPNFDVDLNSPEPRTISRSNSAEELGNIATEELESTAKQILPSFTRNQQLEMFGRNLAAYHRHASESTTRPFREMMKMLSERTTRERTTREPTTRERAPSPPPPGSPAINSIAGSNHTPQRRSFSMSHV